MIYADWCYYTGVYLGQEIKEPDFPRFALRASRFLDYYTKGRAQNAGDLDALRLACCALAEQYQVIVQARALSAKDVTDSLAAGREVKSESVGSYTVAYGGGGERASAAAALAAQETRALSAIAQTYLAGTGLLYRGRCAHVYPACCDGL